MTKRRIHNENYKIFKTDAQRKEYFKMCGAQLNEQIIKHEKLKSNDSRY